MKPCCLTSCFLPTIVRTRMAFLTMFWQLPMTGVCANTIQIPSVFWASVQTCPESLWATLFLPHCFEILSLRIELRDRILSSTGHPELGSPETPSIKLTTQNPVLGGGAARSKGARQRLLACWEGCLIPAQQPQPFVWALFCLLGQKLIPLPLLYKPAHLKGPVSHGFQVIKERQHVLVAELPSDF